MSRWFTCRVVRCDDEEVTGHDEEVISATPEEAARQHAIDYFESSVRNLRRSATGFRRRTGREAVIDPFDAATIDVEIRAVDGILDPATSGTIYRCSVQLMTRATVSKRAKVELECIHGRMKRDCTDCGIVAGLQARDR